MRELKSRRYRSVNTSETINIKDITPPCRLVDGKIVNATFDGKKWTF